MEANLYFNDVFPVACLHLHLAEVQRRPILFQPVLPIDHLPADGAFVGSARVVGNRCR